MYDNLILKFLKIFNYPSRLLCNIHVGFSKIQANTLERCAGNLDTVMKRFKIMKNVEKKCNPFA